MDIRVTVDKLSQDDSTVLNYQHNHCTGWTPTKLRMPFLHNPFIHYWTNHRFGRDNSSSMACLVSYNSHKLWEKTHRKTFPATDTSYLLKKHSKCECTVMTAGHRYVVHLNTEANEVKIWLRMWVPFRTIDYNGRRRCLECVTKWVRGFVWHHQLECAFNGIAACDVSLR